MIAPDQLEALRDAVGDGDLHEHEPIALDGVAAALTLSPSNGERLSRTLATLRRCGAAGELHVARAHRALHRRVGSGDER